MKKRNGYAALVLIFIIGMVSLFLSLMLLNSGFVESMGGRAMAGSDEALFAAQSGIEEVFNRLSQNPVNSFGGSGADFTMTIQTGIHPSSAYVVVTNLSPGTRLIKSEGTAGRFVRRVKASILYTTVTPGFTYAIHGGGNGIEISSSKVDGNVYSNGYIRGNKIDLVGNLCKTTGTNNAWINGTANAVDTIGELDTSPNAGVCISKEAEAAHLNECWVVSSRTSPNAVSSDCGGVINPPINGAAPIVQPFPISDQDIDTLKTSLVNHGTTFIGTCTINGSANPGNCGGLLNSIGNIIITGDLIVASNNSLTITQPVWVKGNIIFNSNVLVTTSATSGQIILTDQPMTIDSNTSFGHNGMAYLLFISTYSMYPAPSPTPTPGPSSNVCDTPAVTISSNTSNVLFYAPFGCALVNAHAKFTGSLVADKVKIVNNSEIEYDSFLASATFSTSKEGGWQIQTFSEY